MTTKNFKKDNRPTLMWYKVNSCSRVKRKKVFTIPKAIRVIDYHKQLAEILTCQYNCEINFRLENDIENDQFIFTIPCSTGGWDRGTLDDLSSGGEVICETEDAMLSRLSPLPKIDWKPGSRFKGKTIAETIQKYCKSCLKNKERNYLNCWLRGYSKFDNRWKVEYECKNKEKFSVADVLEKLQSSKIPFRVECLWDDGFSAVLVNKKVTPSRLQVDEYNDKHQEVDANALLEVPENDWVERFHEREVEDVVKQLHYYLRFGKSKPKLSPEFIARRKSEIYKIIEEASKEYSDEGFWEKFAEQ